MKGTIARSDLPRKGIPEFRSHSHYGRRWESVDDYGTFFSDVEPTSPNLVAAVDAGDESSWRVREKWYHAGMLHLRVIGAALFMNARFAVCIAVGLAAPACGSHAGQGSGSIYSLDRIKAIARDVERIRGLAFTNDVGFEVQSIEDLKSYASAGFSNQITSAEADAYMRGLVKLGALKEPLDMLETTLALAESQVAAHYDPHRDCYCLIRDDMPSFCLDIVTAHELCHGLQDHHFDLEEFIYGNAEEFKLNGDAECARRCLIEGEATLVMNVWSVMSQLPVKDPESVWGAVSLTIDMQAGVDADTLVAFSGSQMDLMGLDPESADRQREQIETLPRFVMETMLAQYMQGAKMAVHIRKRKGWQGLNALYSRPPESTEQILHPEKLLGDRDLPRDAAIPGLAGLLPPGWEMTEQDVLGELGMGILLTMYSDENSRDRASAKAAAAGWGGDRYYLCEDKGRSRDLLLWKTVWDTVTDANEFVTVYSMFLARRFPGLKEVRRSGGGGTWIYRVWEVEPGRFVKLARHGDTVGIVDAADRSLLDILWK